MIKYAIMPKLIFGSKNKCTFMQLRLCLPDTYSCHHIPGKSHYIEKMKQSVVVNQEQKFPTLTLNDNCVNFPNVIDALWNQRKNNNLVALHVDISPNVS